MAIKIDLCSLRRSMMTNHRHTARPGTTELQWQTKKNKWELCVIHAKFMDLSASFLLLQSKQIIKPNQKLIMHQKCSTEAFSVQHPPFSCGFVLSVYCLFILTYIRRQTETQNLFPYYNISIREACKKSQITRPPGVCTIFRCKINTCSARYMRHCGGVLSMLLWFAVLDSFRNYEFFAGTFTFYAINNENKLSRFFEN